MKHFKTSTPISILILVVGISLFHIRGLRQGHTFLPADLANNNLPWRDDDPTLQNQLISDPLYQFYPFLEQSLRIVKDEGRWPLWNPNILLGHPSLGDPLAQTFYPVILSMGLLFGAARGFGLGLWLQALFGGICMFGWLRETGSQRFAAVAGAWTWVLSGYLVTWFETTFWTSTLTMLPAILWACERAVQTRSRRTRAPAMLCYGLALLGGQFQFMIVFTIVLGLYLFGRIIETHRLRAIAILFCSTVGVGVLLSAIALLPAVEFLGESRRLTSAGLQDSLPVQQLLTLLVPNFFGTPNGYWGALNYGEATIYAGIVGLLLASVAVVFNRRFLVGYIAVVTLLLVYFIVGGPGVQLLNRLPGVRYASLHRSLFLLPLLIAFLLAHSLSSPIRFRPILVASLFGTFVLGVATASDVGGALAHLDVLQPVVLRYSLLVILANVVVWYFGRSTHLSKILAAIVYIDLFLFGATFNPVGAVDDLLPSTAVTEFLQSAEPQRLLILQRNETVTFGPNVVSVFDLAEAGGYSSLIMPRYHQIASLADPEIDIGWMQRSGNMMTFSDPDERLYDLFAVSHVVSPEPLDVGGVRTERLVTGCDGTLAIAADAPLTGEFTVWDTAINRIDLKIDNSLVSEDGTLTLRVWRDEERTQLIVENVQPATDLVADGNWITFFAPQVDALGQTYYWEVSSDREGVSLCQDESEQPALSLFGSDWQEVFVGDELFVYQRLNALPRVQIVYAAEQIADDSAAQQRLMDRSFPQRHVAITEQPVALPTSPDVPATSAEIIHETSTEIVINATAQQDGLLILADSYYPGWAATVDGESAEIIRTNQLLRGVPLAAGTHEVIFRFQPNSLRSGMALSGVGLVIIAALLIFPKRQTRQTSA